ncbi:MAG TPA: hypothetical protein DCG57_20925, partial [Candidatus Riflebacteria bacterium]|nr:hypothetical protein [Candidatus Riflebacteria bacterium]
IAARIQTFADTNDVFISESTYLAMNRNEFGAVDLGAQELKNATREIKIYKVLKNGSPGVTLPAARKPVPGSSSSAALSDTHKKLIAGALIGAFVLCILVAGYVIGARRNRALPPQPPGHMGEQAYHEPILPLPGQPRPQPGMPQGMQSQPGMSPGMHSRAGNTLLTADPFALQLNINEHERRIIGDVQRLCHERQFNRAEIVCGEMVYRVGDQQKPIFALLLSEVFWMQKKSRDAEQLFANLRSSPLPDDGKKKLELAIANIKQRQPD